MVSTLDPHSSFLDERVQKCRKKQKASLEALELKSPRRPNYHYYLIDDIRLKADLKQGIESSKLMESPLLVNLTRLKNEIQIEAQ